MASSVAHPPPKRGSWSSVNSHQLMRNYDKSPIASPKNSPPATPALSRNNSTASINSTRSEPAWHSGRHASDASVGSTKTRQDSTSSQASAQTTASHKKGGFMGGLFHKPTKEEKEKKKKETEKIVIGSKHAAAVKTKMMMDPKYREFQEKHKKPAVKTAGITGHTASAHSSAASQEARHPHSGPPAVHGDLDFPMLGRIDSHDETDSDEDPIERERREWNTAIEHNMAEIPEIRSRQASARPSPWASPIQSREPSPNRLGGARPSIGKRNSYAGGYHRDANGRWTKKASPPGAMTPVHHPHHGGVNADLLAASLAQRLDQTA